MNAWKIRFIWVLRQCLMAAGFLFLLQSADVAQVWGQEDATLPMKVEEKVNAPAAPDTLEEAPVPDENLSEGSGIGASFSGALEGSQPAGLGLGAGEVPDEYVIQKGDTLWDISARFFEKPEYWPKLWSYNPYITNPHLIFPNNKLVFKPGTETQPPSVEVAGPAGVAVEPQAIAEAPSGEMPAGEPGMSPGEATPEGEMSGNLVEKETSMSPTTAASTSGPGFEGATVTLREDGYISKTSEQSLGSIFGAPVGVGDLAETQDVYLKLKSKDQVQIGDQYTVFREVKKVRGTGYLNKVLGIVKVVSLKDNIVKANITRSYYPILRGDQIREYYNALHQVRLTEASNPVDGSIIERLNYENIDIGQGDVVYIDRGNRDGVEPGYEFLVLRRQDGLERKESSSYPNEIVGRLVVVVARGNNSTAVVVKSKDALKVGDRITTPRKE